MDASIGKDKTERSSGVVEVEQPVSEASTPATRTRKAQSKAQKPAPNYERRILLLSILTGLPGGLVTLLLLWFGDYTPKVQWTLSVFVFSFWLGSAFVLRERVVLPLQTLSNLLAALREGDFSLRGRAVPSKDALGDVLVEVNALADLLQEQRLGALEATALLRNVMAEIDVAIFTFDTDQRLRLVNRAGERLLAQPVERLLGRKAEELGLAGCLNEEVTGTISMNFPGASGRWGVRRSSFREEGRPHRLLVLSDLSRPLREEERQAWQRLIRVLGHELNNSLTPIKSMAGSMESLLRRDPPPPDWKEDMQRGLSVIASRSEALSRFMVGYARLAKLPSPRLEPLEVGAWIRRVVGLETRLSISLEAGPPLTIQADGDQLDQLLINLLRNAVDASLETGGEVTVGWGKSPFHVDVWVRDEGPGLANTTNLFVPFFTTKPAGSGIGLVLSRQIAEGHGGSLSLENRKDRRGCEARLRLPT
ncbi:MAG TPA: ATP-binding protein [Terriglobia bacterium]|nr:ATP-binding protein [Terriglobia bacterium]